MRLTVRLSIATLFVCAFVLPSSPRAGAPAANGPGIDQFLSAAYPFSLQSARKAERLAWVAYDQGKRNAFTAAAPDFRPVRLTPFLKDDGTEIGDLKISDDGSTVIFTRGTAPNRDGWVANASADPDGAERAVWAAKTATPGVAWRVVEGNGVELAPDGSAVTFAREGQIYRAKISAVKPAMAIDRAEVPFIKAWGTNSGPRWSPDGARIAFTSARVDHSFIAIYEMKTRKVSYLAPDVDRDSTPMWIDNTHVAFLRRPGLPFGQQAQQGSGGIGLPNGPAYQPAQTQAQPARGGGGGGRNGGGGGRNGGGGAAQAQTQTPPVTQTAPPAQTTAPPAQNAQNAQNPQGRGQGGGRGGGGGDQNNAQGVLPGVSPEAAKVPGLTRATLKGGHTLALMVGDVTTGTAKEIWHPAPDGRAPGLNGVQWADGKLIYTQQVPNEEGTRYFAIDVTSNSLAKPYQLTTTSGIIEDATSMALSKDGKTLYYCTNTNDIERRHIWAVPTAGGAPQQITTGAEIETSPMPLASGRLAALTAGTGRPQSVGLFPAKTATAPALAQQAAASQKVLFPVLTSNYPLAAHVTPELVVLKSPDGVEVHDQLFVPKNSRPGEKHPAMIFVHGGPVRQMLLGYHYMHFYHMAYAVNQWLASQGYVVLSVNYRSGVGYGTQFRSPGGTGGAGNSEYQDVLTAGKYLQSRPDVDPKRVGIWGLSYGGVLTAQALARNSDIFAAGVDLAGVHLWGSSLDPESTSYKSSAIAAIDKWKSPVFLIHGDDDRNVAFQQTTGLVQLLRQRDVYYELMVLTDDTHETMLHSRWLELYGRMDTFLKKFLGGN